MAFMDQVLKGVNDLTKGILREGPILSGNAAVNSIGKVAGGMVQSGSRPFAERGIHGTVRGMSKGLGLPEAAKQAFTKQNGNVNWGTVAGSYIGVSAGYRAMSGGGAYRDKNGNTNIAGIPFV